MVRNLSPMLRRELQNLDKDPESRKHAIKALKLYVKDLDSKTIPHFLAQVSETKDVGSPGGEHTISLYEVLARTQGTKIVPHIGNIMASIVMTLSASAGSVALHQACAKVVPTIARYGIDPTTPDEKKKIVIHSLCKPLSDCLMGSQESLSAGAALCLKALVESDNWRFASSEMVNEVALKVAGALEGKGAHINSLMSLVTALAKQNALILEAYARLLVNSGLRILQAGVVEGNSQKRFSAIQMVHSLLKSLDPRCVFSVIGSVIEWMEKCQSDQIGYVTGAAHECLRTAKEIAARNESKFKLTGSYAGSNNIQRESSQSYMSNGATGTHSLDSSFASPESQTLGSFGDNGSFHESPISTSHSSCNNGYSHRSGNRKLWRQGNGEVDVSLKDGILSGIAQGSTVSNPYSGGLDQTNNKIESTNEFAGFALEHITNDDARNTATSPPRTRSLVNPDTVKIYSTPRRLIRSVQDPVDLNSEIYHKQFRKFLSPSSNLDWSPLTGYEQNSSVSHNSDDDERKVNGYTSAETEEFQIGSESVSSTEDIVPKKEEGATNTVQIQTPVQEVNVRNTTECHQTSTEIKNRASYRLLVCILFAALAVIASLMLTENQDNSKGLVPT